MNRRNFKINFRIFIYFAWFCALAEGEAENGRKTYVIRYKDGEMTIPVTVVLDYAKQTEHVINMSPRSPAKSVTLYDFKQRTIAYKDLTNSECFLGRLTNETMSEESSALEHLENPVEGRQRMRSLDPSRKALTPTEIRNLAGMKTAAFCQKMNTWLLMPDTDHGIQKRETYSSTQSHQQPVLPSEAPKKKSKSPRPRNRHRLHRNQSATESDDLFRPKSHAEKGRRHNRRANGHRPGKRHVRGSTNARDESIRKPLENPEELKEESFVGATDRNGIFGQKSSSGSSIQVSSEHSLKTGVNSEPESSHQPSHHHAGSSRYQSDSRQLTASERLSTESFAHHPVNRVASDAPVRSSLSHRPLSREFDFETPSKDGGNHSSRNIESDFDPSAPRRTWSPARSFFEPFGESSDDEDPDVSTNVLEVPRITHKLENITADGIGVNAAAPRRIGGPRHPSHAARSNTGDELPTGNNVLKSSHAEEFPGAVSVSLRAPSGDDRSGDDGIQSHGTGYQSVLRSFKPDEIVVNVGSNTPHSTPSAASVFTSSVPTPRAQSVDTVRAGTGISITHETAVSTPSSAVPSSVSNLPRAERLPPRSNRSRLATLHPRGMARSGHHRPHWNHHHQAHNGGQYQPLPGHNLSQSSNRETPFQHNDFDYLNQLDRLPPGVSIHPRHPQAPFADMAHSNRPSAIPLDSENQPHRQFHHRQRHHRKKDRLASSCCSHRGNPGSPNQWSLCCSRTFGTVPSSGPSCCSSPEVVPPIVRPSQSDAPFRTSSYHQPSSRSSQMAKPLSHSPSNHEGILVRTSNQETSHPGFNRIRPTYSPSNLEGMIVRSSNQETSHPAFNRARPTSYSPSNHEGMLARSSNQVPYPAFNQKRPTSYSSNQEGMLARSSDQEAYYSASNQMRPASYSYSNRQGMLAWSPNQETSYPSSNRMRPASYSPSNHQGMFVWSSNQGTSYSVPNRVRPASYSPSGREGMRAGFSNQGASYPTSYRIRHDPFSPSSHEGMPAGSSNQGSSYPTSHRIRHNPFSPSNHDRMIVRSPNRGTFYSTSDRMRPFAGTGTVNVAQSTGHDRGRCRRVKLCRTVYESTQKVIVCRNAHVEGC